jgi:hypothetical protein
MHTITQNDEKDYDIDVGIVFESNCLNCLGAQATRTRELYFKRTQLVFISGGCANCLVFLSRAFATILRVACAPKQSPEIKTSCVRLKYSSLGYHMDFAVFQRSKEYEWDDNYIYEHAGLFYVNHHQNALLDQ